MDCIVDTEVCCNCMRAWYKRCLHSYEPTVYNAPYIYLEKGCVLCWQFNWCLLTDGCAEMQSQMYLYRYVIVRHVRKLKFGLNLLLLFYGNSYMYKYGAWVLATSVIIYFTAAAVKTMYITFAGYKWAISSPKKTPKGRRFYVIGHLREFCPC